MLPDFVEFHLQYIWSVRGANELTWLGVSGVVMTMRETEPTDEQHGIAVCPFRRLVAVKIQNDYPDDLVSSAESAVDYERGASNSTVWSA